MSALLLAALFAWVGFIVGSAHEYRRCKGHPHTPADQTAPTDAEDEETPCD